MRVLAVDGMSDPRLSRTRRLLELADECARADREGRPVDLIAGDFNSVGTSIGFNALASTAGGYALASRQTRGWRATWPSYFPMYDIDHVWVSKRWGVIGCDRFSTLGSDHRAQVVDVTKFATAPTR